ncbi:hypothetical protein OUZ56_016719 [Daphnia magna]|uniref:Uncharacterized protein n=1 Tax=Daphnia magna TaxID=35525 RepID=A0ABR0ARD5_9CRUS|nr:hypothetical protein OUZ56_016719 [Daphnia magna]
MPLCKIVIIVIKGTGQFGIFNEETLLELKDKVSTLELHFDKFPVVTEEDFLSLCSIAGTITLTATILEDRERNDNYGSLPDFTNESDSELTMSGTGVDISLKDYYPIRDIIQENGNGMPKPAEFDMAAQSVVAHFPIAKDASSTDDNIIYSSWNDVDWDLRFVEGWQTDEFTERWKKVEKTLAMEIFKKHGEFLGPFRELTMDLLDSYENPLFELDSANDRTLVIFLSLLILFPPRPSRSSKGSSLPNVKNISQTLVHRFPDGTNLSEALQQCESDGMIQLGLITIGNRRYIKADLIPEVSAEGCITVTKHSKHAARTETMKKKVTQRRQDN